MELTEIPLWHIDEIEKRNEEYVKNPNIGSDLFEFLEELENELS